MDVALFVEDIIEGGDGLSYKARKDPNRSPSVSVKLFKGFKKILGLKSEEVDPNAPPVELTKEQQDHADMDEYYTVFNCELENQVEMIMPPKRSKKLNLTPEIDETPSPSSI